MTLQAQKKAVIPRVGITAFVAVGCRPSSTGGLFICVIFGHQLCFRDYFISIFSLFPKPSLILSLRSGLRFSNSRHFLATHFGGLPGLSPL